MKLSQYALLNEIADIRFSVLDKLAVPLRAEKVKWITPACLLANNKILDPESDDKYFAVDTALIKKNDILLKRISPAFVNYIDIHIADCYTANNLIRIRPNPSVIDPKYLAFYLESHLNEIIAKASKGTVMSTLSRSELDNFQVDLLPLSEQKAIGEIWYLNTKKKNLQQNLTELEQQKINHQLINLIKHGGKL